MMLTDNQLLRSDIVANSLMNRQRGIVGSNSYQKELRINPLEYLKTQLAKHRFVEWLDLCCGSGRALIEAAQYFQSQGLADRIQITGIDLVNMFFPKPNNLTNLSLQPTAIDQLNITKRYNLITSVHGLHYLGDKLGTICRVIACLTPDGLFVANLDLNNLKYRDGSLAGRQIVRNLRRAGCQYQSRDHLISCQGRRDLSMPFQYLGANDQAGPNYTGQPAVDSIYQQC